METNKDNSVFIYIRGQKGRGNQVIAELERRGGYSLGASGRDATHIYYIGDDGCIRYCEKGDAVYSWIKQHYEEFKLPDTPDDQQLVWAWDNSWKTRRDLVFYDAKYNAAYCSNGRRCGGEYDNYEPYQGAMPMWAIEAQKKLED